MALSDKPIPITCSGCGYKAEKTLAWLKDHPAFPCPVCDQVFRSDPANIDKAIADLNAAENRIDDARRKLTESFKRTSKR